MWANQGSQTDVVLNQYGDVHQCYISAIVEEIFWLKLCSKGNSRILKVQKAFRILRLAQFIFSFIGITCILNSKISGQQFSRQVMRFPSYIKKYPSPKAKKTDLCKQREKGQECLKVTSLKCKDRCILHNPCLHH